MKQVITLSAICIVLGMLLSSCSSNMSIAKRHYNNGYYISYNNGKQSVPKSKAEETVQTKTNKHLHPEQNKIGQNTIVENLPERHISDNNDVVASNDQKPGKTISQRMLKQELRQKIKFFEYPAVQIKQSISESKKGSSDASDEDALSLLWIVIAVILILWLVGFLTGGFGLGGLINLLLVIALVLLILWLLRIL